MAVRWMSRVGAIETLPARGSRSPLHSRAGRGHNKYQTHAESPSKHGVPWVGTEMQAKRTPAAGWSLRCLVAFVLQGCAILSTLESGAHAESPALDFNRDIRPILAENCFYCHGQDANKRQAELRLDVRDAAIEAGAIVPKDPRRSELVARINATDPEELMPPPKSNRRLTPEQKKRLERWIEEGANYATHWAFVAPERPADARREGHQWVRNPIDRFVLAKLEAGGMSPSPEADRATLIKRLSIDLTGLPPTPEEVDAFVADTDPKAYEKLVDRLLASPHYGERMALPWLDAARYADSNGFQQDGDTWQWIWRDWLVKALNDDMPFDQFTIRLLAGDLLPGATTEDKIASGFNRNHLLNGEGGAIAEEQRFVNLFDRIDTTATTWLGLTMACAQCHDHKYDPITQKDYYSLLDAFNRVPESGTPQFFSSRIRVAAPFVELPTEENKARIAELEAKLKAGRGRGKARGRVGLRGLAAGGLRRRQARRREGPAGRAGFPPAQARERSQRRREEEARRGTAQAFRRQGPPGARREAARPVEV